jgi:hypothetical protein
MARSTLFDIQVGMQDTEPSLRPQVGDMAIASWAVEELREKEVLGRRVKQLVPVLLEKFFRGYVVFSPDEAQRIKESAAGLEQLLHNTAPLAANYRLSKVFYLGHRVVDYAKLDWLQEEEFEFKYEKHGPDLILDPSKPNISIMRDGAQLQGPQPSLLSVYTVDPASENTLH